MVVSFGSWAFGACLGMHARQHARFTSAMWNYRCRKLPIVAIVSI